MLNGIKRTCDMCNETFHFSLKHKCTKTDPVVETVKTPRKAKVTTKIKKTSKK